MDSVYTDEIVRFERAVDAHEIGAIMQRRGRQCVVLKEGAKFVLRFYKEHGNG